MRIRTIKPSFWSDQRIRRLTIPARLLYIATWNLADDNGRLVWDADYLAAQVFMSDRNLDVPALMAELVEAGRIKPYEVDGDTYAEVLRFREHQTINRPSKQAGCPPPREHSLSTHGALSEHSPEEGKGREGIEATLVDDLPRPVDNSALPSSSKPKNPTIRPLVAVDIDQRYAEALERAVDAKQATTRKQIHNLPAWRAATRAGIDTERGAAIMQALQAGADVNQALVAAGLIQPPAPSHIATTATQARSSVAGLLLTGMDPAEAHAEALASYPGEWEAITDEVGQRTGWVATASDATIHALPPRTAQDRRKGRKGMTTPPEPQNGTEDPK